MLTPARNSVSSALIVSAERKIYVLRCENFAFRDFLEVLLINSQLAHDIVAGLIRREQYCQ